MKTELPDDKEINHVAIEENSMEKMDWNDLHYQQVACDAYENGAKWMRSIADQQCKEKDRLIEELNKEVIELVEKEMNARKYFESILNWTSDIEVVHIIEKVLNKK